MNVQRPWRLRVLRIHEIRHSPALIAFIWLECDDDLRQRGGQSNTYLYLRCCVFQKRHFKETLTCIAVVYSSSMNYEEGVYKYCLKCCTV